MQDLYSPSLILLVCQSYKLTHIDRGLRYKHFHGNRLYTLSKLDTCQLGYIATITLYLSSCVVTYHIYIKFGLKENTIVTHL